MRSLLLLLALTSACGGTAQPTEPKHAKSAPAKPKCGAGEDDMPSDARPKMTSMGGAVRKCYTLGIAGGEATVKVQVTVAESGAVRETTVVGTSGHPSAVDCLKKTLSGVKHPARLRGGRVCFGSWRGPAAAVGLAALAALLILTAPVSAQSTWNGGGDRNWGVAANWTGGVPNAAGATAIFPGASPGAVGFAVGGTAFTVQNLNFTGGDYTLGAAGNLTAANVSNSAGTNVIDSVLTSSTAINVTGGTLVVPVAGTDPFTTTAGLSGAAAITLNGGGLTLRGRTVAGGLTGQFFGTPGQTSINNAHPEYGNVTGGAKALAGSSTLERARIFSNTFAPEVLSAPNANATAALSQVYFPSVDPAAPFAPVGSNLANNVQARWSGLVNITTAGNYRFHTRSDDGSMVYVNGQVVTNNNAYQGMALGSLQTINLPVGMHRIEVYSYEGGGGAGLQLGMTFSAAGTPATPGNNDNAFNPAVGGNVAIPAAQLFGRQGHVTLTNTVNVTAGSTSALNVENANVVNMPQMNLGAGSTLAVNGDGYARFAATAFGGAGARTFTVNTVGDLGLGQVSGVAGGVTVNKTGVGNLIMDATNAPATAVGLTYNVQAGRLVANGTYAGGVTPNPNPLGDQSVIQLNGAGATLHLRSFGTTFQDFIFDNALNVLQSGTLEAYPVNANLDTIYVLGGAGRNITLGAGTTLTANILANGGRFTDVQPGGQVTGTGNLVKTGTGTMTFLGANTYTGTTTINQGDVVVQNPGSLGTSAVTVNGGTLGLRGSITVGNALTIDGGGAGLGQSGALEAANNSQVANTTPTYSGAITVGTATTGRSATIGMNTNSFVGSFTLTGAISTRTSNTLVLNPVGGNDASAVLQVNGVISGGGNVVKNGGLMAVLAANNTYTGTTTVNSGTLEARGGGGAAVGAGATTINAGGTLWVSQPNALGNSPVTLNGPATLRYDFGAGTATSTATTLTGGEGSRITVASGNAVVMNAATATLAGTGTFFGLREGFILSNGGAAGLDPPNPNNGINGGVVTNVRQGQNNVKSNPVAVPGPANGFAWGDNNTWIYTGQIQAVGTTLTFAEQIDDNVLIRFNSGAGLVEEQLGAAATARGTNWFTPTATRAIPVTPGQWYDIDIRIFHGGGGAGATGSNANGGWGAGWTTTYGFGISDTVAAGTAAGAPANAAESTTDPRYLGTTYFRPGEPGDPLGTQRFRATATASQIVIEQGGSLSLGRMLGGAGGGGDVTFNTLAAGTPAVLALANQGAATASVGGNITTTGDGQATLTVGTNQTLTVGNLNLGAGTTLIKNGAGTLRVSGAPGTGTGALTVSGGAVSGTGRIPGALNLNSGGTVSPGNSVGQIFVGGAATFGGGGAFLFEFNSTTPGANGITHDHLSATGAVNLTATSTAGNQFIIEIRGDNFFPPLGGAPIVFTFATGSSVTGFNPATDQNKFTFPATGFFAGTPTVGLTGNNLTLSFVPAPEPAHLLLLCSGAAGAFGWYRRRKAATA